MIPQWQVLESRTDWSSEKVEILSRYWEYHTNFRQGRRRTSLQFQPGGNRAVAMETELLLWRQCRCNGDRAVAMEVSR